MNATRKCENRRTSENALFTVLPGLPGICLIDFLALTYAQVDTTHIYP